MLHRMILLSPLLLLMACAHNSREQAQQLEDRINQLTYQLKSKESEVLGLKTKNEWLKTKISLQSKKVKSSVVKRPKLKQKHNYNFKKLVKDENAIYQEVIRSFRKSELSQLSQFVRLLKDHFPTSVFIDNSIYLRGQLYFQKKNYGRSLRDFNLVIEKYPNANKRPAALLAKAFVLNHLRLTDKAMVTLQELMSLYPGSLESYRAHQELRLFKLKSKS